MVSGSDVRYKKSQGVGLGGAKTGTLIVSGTPTNFFDDVSATEANAGDVEYRCFYIENGHATEDMDDCDLFLISDNPASSNSTISWGFEPYRWTPYKTYNGTTDFDEEPDAAELQLQTWTIACWVRTNTDFAGNEGILVNKGGLQSDTAGENMSYGVYFRTDNKINAGFETGAGADNFVTSPLTYNDGNWHKIIASYDGSLLSLFIDDMSTAVATLVTSALPEINTKPLRLGKNSRLSNLFYAGDMDEVRVWNRSLTLDERKDLYNWGKVPTNGLVYENKFGTDTYATVAQSIANESTAPKGVNWLGVTNGPINIFPNIGTLEPTFHVPIWVRWTITALAPDSKNDFGLFELEGKIPAGGTGGGGSTPPPAPTAFSFAIVGDWGEESMTEQVAQLCVDEGVSLVCGVGDNSYGDDGDIDSFLDAIQVIDDNQGSDIRFETAFGNHDNAESAEDSTETQLKSHFGYSNTYFSFDMQNVHFLFLDNTTETSFGSGSAQHTFANSDLAAARANSAIDWIVVIVHKPMWGASSDHGYNSGNFNQAYGAMFDTHKVDIIGTGHNHNWQITDQTTYNSSTPTTPTIVDSASPYVGGAGRIHVVSGTGGHDSGSSLYPLGSAPGFQNYQSDDHNGILKCTLSNNNLTMTLEFIDVNGAVQYTAVINR